VSVAIHWSGPMLAAGALLFGLAIVLISREPVINQVFPPNIAALSLAATALLIVSLPGMYAVQAEAAGVLGLVAHGLLTIGLLLVVVVAAPPLLYPSLNEGSGENVVVFVLGIALVLGLLLTGIATLQAGVFPRPAAILLLAAMAGFFFVFFIAEFLPPAAGQVGAALFGGLLAFGFAWIGMALWIRTG
jgi:hypothetical protein